MTRRKPKPRPSRGWREVGTASVSPLGPSRPPKASRGGSRAVPVRRTRNRLPANKGPASQPLGPRPRRSSARARMGVDPDRRPIDELRGPSHSGCAGTAPSRRLFGKSEQPHNIVGPVLNPFVGKVDRLRLDQQWPVAPCALLATEGTRDAWTNPQGSQRAHLAARRAYEFLGVPDRPKHSLSPGRTHPEPRGSLRIGRPRLLRRTAFRRVRQAR